MIALRLLGFVVLSLAVAAQAPHVLAQDMARPHIEHLNGSGVLPAEPALPFSEAVRVGDVVFLSGMIGHRPGTLELVSGGTAAEARQTMENIGAILEAHGYSLSDIVKCTVMMEDISEWAAFNEVYQTFFEAPYPARSAFGADGLAVGARVEVECIAVVSDQMDPHDE